MSVKGAEACCQDERTVVGGSNGWLEGSRRERQSPVLPANRPAPGNLPGLPTRAGLPVQQSRRRRQGSAQAAQAG